MSNLPTVKIAADNRFGFKIINERDFDPEAHTLFGAAVDAESFTRESVAAMGKADVRDLLEAHGVDVPKGASVGTMRDMLTRVMFVDL